MFGSKIKTSDGTAFEMDTNPMERRIRKVRSLDFARFKASLSHEQQNAPCDVQPDCKASKFSHAAQRGRYSCRRRSTEKLPALLLSDLDSSDSFNGHHQHSRGEDIEMRLTTKRWTAGYVSMIMLLLFTVSNFALDFVDAQMHRLDSPTLYDVLSMEVIMPPFSYVKKAFDTDRPRLGLGTAAISSITETLSPIIPFMGGLDLRRDDVWDTQDGWFNTVYSVVDLVRDAFGLEPLDRTGATASLLAKIPRSGGQSNLQNKVVLKTSGTRRTTKHIASLSAQEPFVSIETISSITLGDLANIFEYAIHQNREGGKKLQQKMDSHLKPIIQKFEAAIETSRGKDVKPAQTGKCDASGNTCDALSPAVGYGDIEALQFCAAMRLFAEWRIVRQVPDGYKGYAVGMSLGHKDVVQNVAKIENAVHAWLDHRRELMSLEAQWRASEGMQEGDCDVSLTFGNKVTTNSLTCELRSPTLRDLLEHEIDMESHPSLPRLKDKTAAMGLLWVRRQLAYQTSIFNNILKIPRTFPDANAAVSAAYSEVYGKYHGWTVQKIFNYSFQAAPDVREIYKFMNPFHLHHVKSIARTITPVDGSVERMDSGDSNNEKYSANKAATMNPLEQIVKHLGAEWDKLVGFFGGNGGVGEVNIRGGDQGEGLQGAELEAFVVDNMTKKAHEHIEHYLETANPLLRDLAGLFDDLNMEDPTKV